MLDAVAMDIRTASAPGIPPRSKKNRPQPQYEAPPCGRKWQRTGFSAMARSFFRHKGQADPWGLSYQSIDET